MGACGEGALCLHGSSSGHGPISFATRRCEEWRASGCLGPFWSFRGRPARTHYRAGGLCRLSEAGGPSKGWGSDHVCITRQLPVLKTLPRSQACAGFQSSRPPWPSQSRPARTELACPPGGPIRPRLPVLAWLPTEESKSTSQSSQLKSLAETALTCLQGLLRPACLLVQSLHPAYEQARRLSEGDQGKDGIETAALSAGCGTGRRRRPE